MAMLSNKVLRCEASNDTPIGQILAQAKFYFTIIPKLDAVEVMYGEVSILVTLDTTKESFMQEYNNKLSEYKAVASPVSFPPIPKDLQKSIGGKDRK